MVYLAQVKTHSQAQEMSVLLLAERTAATQWVACPPQEMTVVLPTSTATMQWRTGALVLLTLDTNKNCSVVEDAVPVLLQLITQPDAQPLPPDAQVIEQWRQELTLKSQEISMKALELATQRERLEAKEAALDQHAYQIAYQSE